MSWKVIYSPRAEQELTAAWLASPLRVAFTSAANRIDRILTIEPENAGQFRFDTVATLVIPPVGVEYEIISQKRLVWVLHVWDPTASSGP